MWYLKNCGYSRSFVSVYKSQLCNSDSFSYLMLEKYVYIYISFWGNSSVFSETAENSYKLLRFRDQRVSLKGQHFLFGYLNSYIGLLISVELCK